ncbi:hypothetical protein T265_00595 [Opisthorchis viverrini]|uniref:Uncharacterized protein n=1 Tax=Opisthorchis viverrini TaxID=6198 RepID=A0A075AC74_OPIVI|nr:hypothetical protein T265_00595 [Opisthorchis viverrini]KER33480.1 hypothetical protein T265_00595 [Opisthorchis viverrini]
MCTQMNLVMREDSWRARQLVRKIGVAEHERFTNYILPRKPSDLTFDETVAVLSSIFGEQASLFSRRVHCMNLSKNASEDWVTYAGKVNKDMTEDEFKCLIFVCGLTSPEDTDIRARILSKVEQNSDVKLQNIT